MKPKLTLLFLILVSLLLFACTASDPFPTHKFTPREAKVLEGNTTVNTFEDLKNDHTNMFIYTYTGVAPQNHLLVNDINLKVISQVNHYYPIRGVKAIKDPITNQTILFYSFNDQRKVYLIGLKYDWTTPLRREDWVFEPIDRTDRLIDDPAYEWHASMAPEFIEDIDGDGRQELVCRAWDSFTTNPRGLIVYDYATRKIKWKYLIPTSISTLLFDDFDGDGHKEFIFGTNAFKNTRDTFSNLDDDNGWLVILDRFGKEILTQKQCNGYGGVYIGAHDNDGNGIPEIYKQVVTWGSSETTNYVESMKWDGSQLLRIHSYRSDSPFEPFQSMYLQEMDNSGTVWYLVLDKVKGLTILDANLLPIKSHLKLHANVLWGAEDITQNGYKEILIQTEDDRFVIMNHKARIIASMNNPMKGESNVIAYIVETGFGKPRYIAFVSGRKVQYYSVDKYPVPVLFYNLVHQYWIFVVLGLLLVVFAVAMRTFNARRMLRGIANSAANGVIIVNGQNRIRFINLYLRTQLSASAGGVLDHRLNKSFPELCEIYRSFRQSGTASLTVQQQITLHSTVTFEKIHFLRIGMLCRHYILSLIPLQSDASEMHDKLAWADTARRLSHHVRRHITNVLLAIEPLDGKCAQDADSQDYMRIIRDEINQIKVFTHAFQRFTELKDYDLQPQDIIPSLEHCISRINIPKSINLVKDWSLQSVSAFIEPIRFEEALTNLVGNAIEALPEGGTIQLSVKEFPHHSGKEGDLGVLIEIEDNGNGISPKYLDEIWQPFFTTKQSGTGIGLPETKKIIESMHGTIQIQSEQNIGTLVSVWLRGK